MPLPVIHDRLADTASLFIAFLGVWALVLAIRAQPLSSSWLGAAFIGELLLLVQAGLGVILYVQGLGVVLPRPFMHILYGIVAIITLPAAYGYFGNLEDERTKSLAMAAICLFLWGILLRAGSVAEILPPAA
jgi:hypothetical protein